VLLARLRVPSCHAATGPRLRAASWKSNGRFDEAILSSIPAISHTELQVIQGDGINTKVLRCFQRGIGENGVRVHQGDNDYNKRKSSLFSLKSQLFSRAPWIWYGKFIDGVIVLQHVVIVVKKLTPPARV